jgi:galactose-1-phosphate uridylyltransferase
MTVLNKWKRDKTKENRCEYVEKEVQYKAPMVAEKEKW